MKILVFPLESKQIHPVKKRGLPRLCSTIKNRGFELNPKSFGTIQDHFGL